jgi:hypothetical protein
MVISLVVSIFMFGCSIDPMDAHPENFKKALQVYTDKNSSCFLRIQLPFTVDSRSLNPFKAKYDALVAADVISFDKTGEHRNVVAGRGTVITELGTYTLNPQYQATYEPAKEVGKGQIGCFTGRKITIGKILEYTEPVDVGGYMVTEVSFEYTVTGLPAWLDHPEMAKQYPQVVAEYRAKGSPVKAKRPLGLYQNGWEAQ